MIDIKEKGEREKINITDHAYKRYAERIMGKETNQDICVYVQENKELIEERLQKLYNYSDFIWEGKLDTQNERNNIFVKDNWVIVIDKNGEKIITLYEADFGLGDDFNKTYMERTLQKFNDLREQIKTVNDENTIENNKIRLENDALKNMIKDKEKDIENLKNIINVNQGLISKNQSRQSLLLNEEKDMIRILTTKKM